MYYETIEKHFTAPIRISPYYDNVKIPRKLKKKVKNFCGIHYKSLTNSQRLQYYLDKANPNYKRFLIKLITKPKTMIKVFTINEINPKLNNQFEINEELQNQINKTIEDIEFVLNKQIERSKFAKIEVINISSIYNADKQVVKHYIWYKVI